MYCVSLNFQKIANPSKCSHHRKKNLEPEAVGTKNTDTHHPYILPTDLMTFLFIHTLHNYNLKSVLNRVDGMQKSRSDERAQKTRLTSLNM